MVADWGEASVTHLPGLQSRLGAALGDGVSMAVRWKTVTSKCNFIKLLYFTTFSSNLGLQNFISAVPRGDFNNTTWFSPYVYTDVKWTLRLPRLEGDYGAHIITQVGHWSRGAGDISKATEQSHPLPQLREAVAADGAAKYKWQSREVHGNPFSKPQLRI